MPDIRIQQIPARVPHLLPMVVLVEQLSPSYATAVNRLPDEVYDEVKSGLELANLRDGLVRSTWEALCRARPALDANALVEKIAKAMKKAGGGPRPMPAAGRELEAMSTLFAFIDVNVGRASEVARAALETEAGQKMLKKSLDATGTYLAARLLAAAGKSKGET